MAWGFRFAGHRPHARVELQPGLRFRVIVQLEVVDPDRGKVYVQVGICPGITVPSFALVHSHQILVQVLPIVLPCLPERFVVERVILLLRVGTTASTAGTTTKHSAITAGPTTSTVVIFPG